MGLKIVLCLGFLAVVSAADKICKPRKFSEDSIVCVCDGKYCDAIDPVLPAKGEYMIVTTNKAGLRFATSYGYLSQPYNDVYNKCMSLLHKKSAIFNVRRDEKAQKIMGYGGAFTDAVGYLINDMTPKMQDRFFDSYFTKEGLNYNMARTTIGHCDFSKYEYYYTKKENDWTMKSFALRSEDFELRLPHIKRAMKMVPDLMITTNVWTVPAWLRENDGVGVRSRVIEARWYSYCLYIMKYLELFRNEGVEFWTVGFANEPTLTANILLFTKEDQMFTVWAINKLAEFAVKFFAPALKAGGFNNTKIMFFDDSRNIMLGALEQSFINMEGMKEIMSYIGLHSYDNEFISTKAVDMIHEKQPNITIITSELCAGQGKGVRLGSWSTAEFYAQNYIEEMNHHYSGWIDWNLVLDPESQPRYMAVPVDAPIIFNKTEFYKQPSYYAIGQFSKFIPHGSVKINLASEFHTDVQHTAALRPDGLVTVVLFNKSNSSVDAKIKDKNGEIRLNLSPNSITTVLF